MVSECVIRWCANEKPEPQRRWTRDSMPARTLGPKGGGGGLGVPHRLEKGTSANKDTRH